ncbi:hypothetical protein [Candidatus Enterovibrio escicola]|uniref:hypothetical protein n=1 Tax=Candidatus Enterovibrio escicola TaxID=1927127 RepID=UPI001CC29911|nr:hypothetical protein [Candidatus Enterovibrio escacola]
MPKISGLKTCLSYLATLTTQFETCFKQAAGKVIHLEQYAHNQHQQRVQGRQSAMRLLG